jgi:predicted dehydrogenase
MKQSAPSIKVALLGCGQIADAHLSQIQRIPYANVVGVCDHHEELAYQAAKRYNVANYYNDLDTMLEQVQPDVVHITTPAHTHAPLALQLLDRNCHVMVEKPFTQTLAEARTVLSAAQEKKLKVCVGHDQNFDPMWLRFKTMIEVGLVGEVINIESLQGYFLTGQFGSLVATNPNHWVRKLPGGLFQNVISHLVARMADIVDLETCSLRGEWWSRSGYDFPSELDISLFSTDCSCKLQFLTVIPPQRITRVFGEKGMLAIDHDTQVIHHSPLPKLRGALAKLEASYKLCGNSLANLTSNVSRFIRSDIHYFAGMKNLFDKFYLSILNDTKPPIAPKEIDLVTSLMEQIFDHCKNGGCQDLSTKNSAETESSFKHGG